MESKDLDKLFQDVFEHAEETPSSRVWEGIEQHLAQQKKVIPFYIKYKAELSIAATFLLFFSIGLTLYNQPISSGREKIEEVLAQVELHNNSSQQPLTLDQSNVEIDINSTKEEKIEKHEKNTPPVNKEEKIPFQTGAILNNDEKISVEKVQIHTAHPIASVEIELASQNLDYDNVINPEPIQEDIQPVFVQAVMKEETKPSIVTRVLNGITKNIFSKSLEAQDNREIEFKNDEEGNITLHIINSFAKK